MVVVSYSFLTTAKKFILGSSLEYCQESISNLGNRIYFTKIEHFYMPIFLALYLSFMDLPNITKEFLFLQANSNFM